MPLVYLGSLFFFSLHSFFQPIHMLLEKSCLNPKDILFPLPGIFFPNSPFGLAKATPFLSRIKFHFSKKIFTDLHSGLNFSAGWPHPLPSHTSRFIIIQCCFILQDMSNLRTWILPALFIDAFLLLKKSTLHLVCVQKYIWVILLNDRATIFPGTGFKSLFSYQVWDKLLFLYYLPHKALCMKRLFTL